MMNKNDEPIVNPLTPKEYEAYVGELVCKLDFAKTGKIEMNRRFEGVRQPGTYEIDVALEVQLAEAINFLLIVECKNWKRPVDRPVVQKLAQTRDAISADKAAIVSPVGFTEEAKSVARSLGVALWIITLDEWTILRSTGHRYFDWQAVRRDVISRDWQITPPITSLRDDEYYDSKQIERVEDLPSIISWARFYGDKGRRDARHELLWNIIAKLKKEP